MFEGLASVRVLEGCTPDALPLESLLQQAEPTVLRGLARDWSLVRAGLESPQAAMAQLRANYNGRPVHYSWGEPATAGRPFYNEGFTALNCEVRRGGLDQVLDELASYLDDPHPPTYYVASLLVDTCLPGLRAGNDLDFAAHGVDAPPAIWIGNRVTASCHYDAPNNIACCTVVTVLPAVRSSPVNAPCSSPCQKPAAAGWFNRISAGSGVDSGRATHSSTLSRLCPPRAAAWK